MGRTWPWQPRDLLFSLEPVKTSRVQRRKMERRLDGSFAPKGLSPPRPPPWGKGGGKGFR